MVGATARGISLKCPRSVRRAVPPFRCRADASNTDKAQLTVIRPVHNGVARNGVSSRDIPEKPISDNSEKITQAKQQLVELESLVGSLSQGFDKDTVLIVLRRVEAVLQDSHLIENAEFLFVVDVIGLMVSASPISKADVIYKPIVDHMTKIVEERLMDLSAGELCLVIRVFGCFGPSVLLPSMFDGSKGVVTKICLRLEGERPQSVKDVIHLFEGLQRMKCSFHKDVTHHTLLKLSPVLRYTDAKMDDIATLVLLSAKLRVSSRYEFLRAVYRLVRTRVQEFSDRALNDLVKGFVIYDLKMKPTLFESVTTELKKRIESVNVSLLIDTTLDLSKINYLPDEEFLSLFSQRVLREAPNLTAKDVSSCGLAMGHLHIESVNLMNALIARFYQTKDAFDAHQICNFLLGVIRLDVLTEDLLRAGLTKLKQQLTLGLMKRQGLIIHQVLTTARLRLGMTSIPSDIFPENWQIACQKEWDEDQRKLAYRSKTTLVKTLEELGLNVRQQHSPIGGIPIVVFTSPDGTRRIVVDLIFERKDCFMNQRDVMLSQKQWQHRLLERQGFELLLFVESAWMNVEERKRARHVIRRLGFDPRRVE